MFFYLFQSERNLIRFLPITQTEGYKEEEITPWNLFKAKLLNFSSQFNINSFNLRGEKGYGCTSVRETSNKISMV